VSRIEVNMTVSRRNHEVPRVLEQALPSDADLVSRVRSGERWAADALYRRHAPDVLRVVLRLTANRADAEDVLHDAFVRALANVDSLRDAASFPGWLTRIAIQEARMKLRRANMLRRLGFGYVADATLDALAAPGIDPASHAELARIARELQRFSADDRIAWVLRHVEGRDLQEIADLTDVSLATAKRRLTRASEALRTHLALNDEGGVM
jgi:RNA polymerase sigma-70 factor (ECF subfamily)